MRWFAFFALTACTPAPQPAPAKPVLTVPPMAAAPPPAPSAVSDEVPDYAKPFVDYVPGKDDAELRTAAQEIARRAEAGEPVERAASDALWRCFAAFRPSKTRSLNLVVDLHRAVLAVKAPSYGARAAALLDVPLADPPDPAEAIDQLQFLQTTAVQLIGALGYTDGVRSLVKALLTPGKAGLQAPLRLALTRMPKASEPVLIAALLGTDPELVALAAKDPAHGAVPRVADPLAYISRPAGRDAVLEALESADNDANRAILALELTQFPADARSINAFRKAYGKLPRTASVALLGGANAKAMLLQAAASFFDPSLVPWILKEVAAAKGDVADEMQANGLPAAVKLMTTSSSSAVGSAIGHAIAVPGLEKEMQKNAVAVLTGCKQDPVCYLTVLGTPVPASPPAAKTGHVKAAWMAAMYGSAATRDELVKKMANVDDPSVGVAMLEAIAHLSPQGDIAAADALDAVADADVKSARVALGDSVRTTALKLRSRVP